MFSHDGTVYQVLFEQTKESSSSSSTTTEIQAQTRRAIWSGNRLISKPPTISTIAISKHTLIKTKPATLRAPVTCQAVTDIATGRTLLLVLDLVRTLSNGIALVVYQLRSSTRELSLFVEIPLPEAIIASDSTTTTATLPDIQIKDGPVISCVSNGKIFICSPLDLNDTRTTGSLKNQTSMEWTPKDIDRNVAMENNATQKPWHRTTYRARSAGSQFIAVPQSGTGPFIYQERFVHKNETITSLVINHSFNQINTTNTNTTSNNNSNLSNIANIINTWCGSINATIDCVGYGNSGSGDAILCLAMTTIRHDSSVVHTLLELSLNENRYNNNNKTTTSIAKTTTTLPCRPTSMVLFSTHTSDLSIVLNLSIDIHPDVPRTVLLQRRTNHSTQNELNVIDTFNATSSVFVEDFRCQGNDDVLLFYPPSTSATTSATPSGTTNITTNGENGDVSGEREEVEVDCNVVPLPVLVKSHEMIDGNGKNILSTMAVSKKSMKSSSKSMKSSSSTSKKKKKQLQKEQNEKDLEERTKLKQMLSDRHVSNIDALHVLERNYETSQIMYNHTLNLIGNGLSRNFTKNNNINNGSSSGGGGGTSSMTTSKRKRGNGGNRNVYSKLILPLHVRQEFDEKDTSTTSSSSSSSNNSKQKKKRKTKHNQQSSPSSSSSSSSSAASSSSVVEALRPISGVPTTLPSKYILLKYYVQPTLAASKINVIVELLEKTTSSTSKHKTTKQQDNDKEYLILSGFVSSEQGVNQYATESISVTKPLERKNPSTISNDGSNGSNCRTIQLSTVVDMSGVSFRSGDATVFGVLSSSSSSSTASICLGGLSVAPSMLLSQISQRPASNYCSNNNNNNGNDLHVNLDHVPTVTLLISSDTSSTNGNGNAQLLSTQRIRERVYTSLVTSGNIDPKTIRIDDHLYGCRIQVPLSHGMMSGVGSSGSDGGGLRKILMSLPKGVKVTESKCTSFHLNGMKKCIDDCLKEVRGLFKTDGKKGGGEEDGDVDVAYTNVASLFS